MISGDVFALSYIYVTEAMSNHKSLTIYYLWHLDLNNSVFYGLKQALCILVIHFFELEFETFLFTDFVNELETPANW